MTSRTTPVIAQWALEGKRPNDEDYRILACSTGDLERANFADALSRFQLGELNTLPQVSVSYARHGAQPALSYLALAIHEFGTQGRRAARDRNAREIAYTSYFCLPYRPLAEQAIGYLSAFLAVRAVTLPETDGPPLAVRLVAPTSRAVAIDPLAVRVAPLLLTGQPVCVLGADGTGMLDRLKFIDAVMDLLPYGFRSRMTAATWTRATNRNHRFRLFFSSSPRTDAPDHVVNWAEDPDLVPAPEKEAGEYFDWLQDNLAPLARLAELTGEMGFSRKDTLQALEALLGARHRFWLRPRPAAQASTGPAAVQEFAVQEFAVTDPASPEPPPSAPVHGDACEAALLDCAEHAKLANPARLRSGIAYLTKFAEGEISEDSRARYQDLIARLGLLRHDFPVKGKFEERLYAALLSVAFGTPIGYPAYCRIETCAGIAPGEAPHQELLAAILSIGMTPVVSAIVHGHLAESGEKALNKWLVSGAVDVVELINLLAQDWRYPQHARIVCDLLLNFLKRAPRHYRPHRLRAALRQHGFLAHALEKRFPDNDTYQVYALRQFLKVAYPQAATAPGRDLSSGAILQILNGTGASPPTPALLSAVLMMLDTPQACQLAWKAYVHGSITHMNVDSALADRLRGLVPDIAQARTLAPVEDLPTRKAVEPPA